MSGIPSGEPWHAAAFHWLSHGDLVILVEYPNPAAFLAFLQNPDYRAIVHYRHDGLEDSRLILTTPAHM